jgi:uncharacterized protein YndB with AHSA1/START domain
LDKTWTDNPTDVAENSIVIQAPRRRVFSVLADANRYADWVFGTSRIRASDGWPRAGGRLYHSVGAGRATIDDATSVLECQEPRRLLLLASLGPLGTFRVELLLDEVDAETTRVTMLEEPAAGISKLAGPVGDLAGRVRNALSLRKLKELAEA